MSTRQNIANLTRSKLGSFIIYGGALVIPGAAGLAIHDAVIPDLDQSTNTVSQTAVSEYLSENQGLLNKHEQINALYASAKIQQGADNVLSVKQKQQDLESSLRSDAESFSIRVLNDERLTESDYDLIEDKAKLDVTSDYMPLNLPNVANALFECRIDNEGSNPLAKSENIRDCMIRSSHVEIGVNVVGIISMILLYGVLFAGIGVSRNSNSLEKLAKKIEKGSTPKH